MPAPDDELARALRIADYHAGQHRQAEERADRMAEMVIEKDREATQWADWLHQAEATIARSRAALAEFDARPWHDVPTPGSVLEAWRTSLAVSEEQTGGGNG